MYARIVTFRTEGLSDAHYREVAADVAPAFTTWPGLHAKVWLADPENRTYGGVYLFRSRSHADRSRETPAFQGMVANPAFVDLGIREFDVLDDLTAITAAPLALPVA